VDALPGLDLGLTSAHVPFEEIGRTAARLALDEPDPAARYANLPVTVHVRSTTGPPRHSRV
jgi:DNA-binding LacI/PurR family transcriptional regulator